MGHPQKVLFAWTMFETYARIGELLQITPLQVIVPVAHLTGLSTSHPLKRVSILLHYSENAQPSKTGEYDHCVSLDLPRQIGLAITLARWTASRPQAAGLWTHTYEEFRKTLIVALANLEVTHLAVTAHAFRHGAASHDRAGRDRTAEEVRLRGNWRSNFSTKRYDKSAMLAREWQKLSAYQQKRCERHLKTLQLDYVRLFAKLFEKADPGSRKSV